VSRKQNPITYLYLLIQTETNCLQSIAPTHPNKTHEEKHTDQKIQKLKMANQIHDIAKSITIIYRIKQNPDEKRKGNPQQPTIQANIINNYICNLSEITRHNPSIKQDNDAKTEKKKKKNRNQRIRAKKGQRYIQNS
jgi:hypothetical protein